MKRELASGPFPSAGGTRSMRWYDSMQALPLQLCRWSLSHSQIVSPTLSNYELMLLNVC